MCAWLVLEIIVKIQNNGDDVDGIYDQVYAIQIMIKS